ncbi:M20 family peptidase, partial [Glutamicibacter creatinolyticus]
AIHPMLTVRNSDAAMHTSDFARNAAGTDGSETVLDAGHALTLSIADVANDSELVQRLRAAREQRPSA